MESGYCRVDGGDWGVDGRGKWRVGSGEWRLESWEGRMFGGNGGEQVGINFCCKHKGNTLFTPVLKFKVE